MNEMNAINEKISANEVNASPKAIGRKKKAAITNNTIEIRYGLFLIESLIKRSVNVVCL